MILMCMISTSGDRGNMLHLVFILKLQVGEEKTEVRFECLLESSGYCMGVPNLERFSLWELTHYAAFVQFFSASPIGVNWGDCLLYFRGRVQVA